MLDFKGITHIIKNPAGTYSYVGSVPVSLGTIVPADKAAVMGQRAWRDDNGDLVMVKFPVFQTEREAIEHALENGATLSE